MSKDSFKEDDYPLGVELTEKLRQLADPYHDGMGGCHGPDHTERVHYFKESFTKSGCGVLDCRVDESYVKKLLGYFKRRG